MNADRSADLFGLAVEFPAPGWVILDAARANLFTGELLFDLTPPVSVHLDRGEIYLAERSTEPPLGARLIDAGALNDEQLEHGSMRIGDSLHLGRLFDRVPSVDREYVMLMTEMMNDECVAWLATQDVAAVIVTPYRHHSSGVHRWTQTGELADLQPGDPLPAPPPTAAPVVFDPPQDIERETDPIVAWGDAGTEPARPPTVPGPPTAELPPPPVAGEEPPPATTIEPSDSILASDWADRLETHGLPDVDSDPLAVPTSLPPIPAGQPDRFELIWPSGEIDEDFDAGAAVELDHELERDRDRAGPTARVVRSADVGEPDTDTDDSVELWDFENTGPSFGPIEDPPAPDTESETAETNEADVHLTVVTDDAVLSMRNAVETIEAESVASRAAPTSGASTTTEAIRDGELVLPGRVATRTESSVWSIRGFENSTNRSVFDDVAPVATVEPQPAGSSFEPAAVTPLVPATASASGANAEPTRVSALRRLISGIRRR